MNAMQTTFTNNLSKAKMTNETALWSLVIKEKCTI